MFAASSSLLVLSLYALSIPRWFNLSWDIMPPKYNCMLRKVENERSGSIKQRASQVREQVHHWQCGYNCLHNMQQLGYRYWCWLLTFVLLCEHLQLSRKTSKVYVVLEVAMQYSELFLRHNLSRTLLNDYSFWFQKYVISLPLILTPSTLLSICSCLLMSSVCPRNAVSFILASFICLFDPIYLYFLIFVLFLLSLFLYLRIWTYLCLSVCLPVCLCLQHWICLRQDAWIDALSDGGNAI